MDVSTRSSIVVVLCGYAILLYIWVLLPFYFYTPTRSFELPTLLWFIHLITLYIHEAGHFFFRVFGRTIYFLGGSIMQVLVPVVWIVVAVREKSRLAPVALFFTGESLVDVSVYVKDAGPRVLPLLGGHHVFHDWATVLGQWDMIDWEGPLGTDMFFVGWIASLSGIAWGV